jgi:predicted dehydrogenase
MFGEEGLMIDTNNMNILIIGAGRMGIRHAIGALESGCVNTIYLLDMSTASIDNALSQLSKLTNSEKIKAYLIKDFQPIKVDVVIIAATASNRLETCKLALECNPSNILIEKPLGQSYQEVSELVSYFDQFESEVSVNLNTRLYKFVQNLKSDIIELPQLKGPINISFNGGSLGIGANGIHYIDLLYFLYGADSAELVYAEIEPTMLPSGRGIEFGDFGGIAIIKFYDATQSYLGRATISLSSTSTVFGGWEIIGSHGRIRINELEGARVDILRSEDSAMPVYRYAADYLPPNNIHIESPMLSELTKLWLQNLSNNINTLPVLKETLKVHKLMFDWLNHSSLFKTKFPIT